MAGHYFDELEIGQTFRHDVRRTVTEQLILCFIAEKVLDLPKSY